MKNYTLKEIKEICSKPHNCRDCPIENFCKKDMLETPIHWDIEEEATNHNINELQNTHEEQNNGT